MTPEEIARYAEELTRLMRAASSETELLGTRSGSANAALRALQQRLRAYGVDVSALATASKDLAKAEADAAKATEDATNKSAAFKRSLTDSTKGVVDSTKGLMGSLARGSSDFSQLSGVTKSLSNAFGNLLGGIPIVGGVLDAGAKTIGDAAAFIIGQLDVVAKAYQDLGKVGGVTATGIEGLRDQFDRLGLVGLPEFTAAIQKNSVAMAALGNTTSRGATMMGDSLGEITNAQGPFIKQLLSMGYSIDEVTNTVTQFGGNQVLMGNRQIRTTRDLTLASVEYLKEIDLLARATGRSRESVLDEQKKMEADVKFRARLEEMRATGQDKAADELESLVRSVGGPIGEAIRASVAGVPLTKEAQGAFVLMGGAIQDSISAIEAGSTAEKERMRVLQSGVAGIQDFNKNIQFGASDALGGDGVIKQLMDFQALLRRANEKGVDPFELAKQEINQLASGTGKTTDQFVSAQIAVANFSRNLQRIGFDFIEPATVAIEKFTNTLNDAAIKIAKMFGVNLPGVTPSTPTTPGRQAPAAQQAGVEAQQAQTVANTKLEEAAVANDKLRAAEQELRQARLANDRTEAGRAKIKELEDRVLKAKQEAATAEEAEARAAAEARVAHQKHRQKIQEANKIANSVATYEAEMLRAQSDIAKHTKIYDDLMKEKADNAGKETYQATVSRDYVIKRKQQDITEAEERLKKNTDALADARKKLSDKVMDAVKSGTATKAPSGYLEKMIQAESSGVSGPNRQGPGGTPASTAYGVGQMLKGTFEDLAKSAGKGNPLQGKTFEDYKKDVGLQMEALQQLTSNNSQRLRDANLKVTDASLYMAHFLGPDGAIRLLKSPETTPINQAVSPDAMQSNPQVFAGMKTVADFKRWADNKMGNTGYLKGGIATGPVSGYLEMLHGTEAVIPLPDGKTVPVKFDTGSIKNILETTYDFGDLRNSFRQLPDLTNEIGSLITELKSQKESTTQKMPSAQEIGREIVKALSDVTSKNNGNSEILLAELVDLQKNNNSLTQKMLRVSTS